MDMFGMLIILVSWMYMSKLIKLYTSNISSLLHAKQNSIKVELKDVEGGGKTPRFSDYLADLEINNSGEVQSAAFHF